MVGALRRLENEEPEFRLRERVARLLARNTRQEFGFVYGKTGYSPQPEVLEQWDRWLERSFPSKFAAQNARSGNDPRQIRDLLAQVDWNRGNPDRGRGLFQQRSCSHCHGGRAALGPDLIGAARRFSRADLFTAIVQPNKDVSPRYQTTMIETRDGQVFTGAVVYESVDGVILRNATDQTFRVKADDIEVRRALKTSLMPTGLLKDLKPTDLADLYSYLRSLATASPSRRPSG